MKLLFTSDELHNSWVIPDSHANIINAATSEDARFVFHEKNRCFSLWLFRDVKKLSVRAFPNGVELRLNKDIWPFPEEPTMNNRTAVFRNVALNVIETIEMAGVVAWCHLYELWLPTYTKASAKLANVTTDSGGGCSYDHRIKMPNVELTGLCGFLRRSARMMGWAPMARVTTIAQTIFRQPHL